MAKHFTVCTPMSIHLPDPSAFCTCVALVAVRQVLPGLLLLPEDIKVVLVDDTLFFDDQEVTAKVPEGTAILKVAPGTGENLALFLSDSSKAEKLDRGMLFSMHMTLPQVHYSLYVCHAYYVQLQRKSGCFALYAFPPFCFSA